MKITIDTKEDSREEIRKAIQLLSNLVSSSGVGQVKREDLFSSGLEEVKSDADKDFSGSPSEDHNAFVNMFGSSGSETEENKEETTGDFNLGMLGESKREEEKDEDEEIPGVISY